MVNPLVVVALGGNALLRKGDPGTFEFQLENARRTARQLVKSIMDGYRIVITHGNGPQIGAILIQQEYASKAVPPMPLHACGAMSQGLIGYMIQQALISELKKMGLRVPVATVITQVLVNPMDEAFKNPTKYIGPYYTEDEAKKLIGKRGWIMKPDPRGGWRRVVPSPEPIEPVEIEVVRKLVDSGCIVIACGGGGVPVVEEDGSLKGVDAVIDKDLASERLATMLRADILLILTDVKYVMLNYGTPDQKPLRKISVEEAKKYLERGEFPMGSMGPKVLAAIRFIENGGKIAAIGHLYECNDVLRGLSGTVIYGFGQNKRTVI